MSNTIISEGKTSKEAIENGLKKLKVSKNKVDIKVLENEEKRSFFDILAPRIVKVQLTLKEEINNKDNYNKDNYKNENIDETLKNIENFMKKFLEKSKIENTQCEVYSERQKIFITIKGKEASHLIGYRGEVLNALQNIISSIANKNAFSKTSIILDVEEYRKKREKVLENLADKVANSVIEKRKKVVLEPMSAYERKVIHSKLQSNENIETYSIGEEPYRKVVITLKK